LTFKTKRTSIRTVWNPCLYRAWNLKRWRICRQTSWCLERWSLLVCHALWICPFQGWKHGPASLVNSVVQLPAKRRRF